jgi:hypothetical protein
LWWPEPRRRFPSQGLRTLLIIAAATTIVAAVVATAVVTN